MSQNVICYAIGIRLPADKLYVEYKWRLVNSMVIFYLIKAKSNTKTNANMFHEEIVSYNV